MGKILQQARLAAPSGRSLSLPWLYSPEKVSGALTTHTQCATQRLTLLFLLLCSISMVVLHVFQLLCRDRAVCVCCAAHLKIVSILCYRAQQRSKQQKCYILQARPYSTSRRLLPLVRSLLFLLLLLRFRQPHSTLQQQWLGFEPDAVVFALREG